MIYYFNQMFNIKLICVKYIFFSDRYRKYPNFGCLLIFIPPNFTLHLIPGKQDYMASPLAGIKYVTAEFLSFIKWF